jgi:dTDP-4-amino-4,6-dideoxygalactose transaminase
LSQVFEYTKNQGYISILRWNIMHHYNSWPLGKLPVEWQRPEPALLKTLGYQWNDPRDIVSIFEDKLAKYSGSKYAVAVDCCSHALFLCLKFKQITEEVLIPNHTYASVPLQILHAGARPVLKDIHWQGIYELGRTKIYDGAARFTEGMYVGSPALQVLSFQIKKRLPIGKGGAILTDSIEAYQWLKLASYDGRNLNSSYDSPEHIKMFGWHYYMTPEDAARGIIIMDKLARSNPDTMNWQSYPPLADMAQFSQLKRLG